MIRLYVKTPLVQHNSFVLSDQQSHYLQKVMRLKEGDKLLVFNGSYGEWVATVKELSKKITVLQTIEQTRLCQEELDLWLLFSPLKPKRQAFLEEKATELGATDLWPVRCERTVVTSLNTAKMEAHIIEAAEQSGRLTLPALRPLMTLPELLETWPQERVLLFGDETRTAPSLGALSFESTGSYAFFVGPEGGFSPHEFSLLRSHPSFQGVTLNPNILRAETAALAGLAYLQLRSNA